MESIKYIRMIIMVMILILSVFWIKSCKNKHELERQKAKTESENTKAKTLSRPDEYNLLKNGDKPIRVYMNGFKCDYFGGGKKYYHQAQNGPIEIWGGDSNCPTGKGSPNATYADIWYYNEEITVVCKFRH